MSFLSKSEIWSVDVYKVKHLDDIFNQINNLQPIFSLPKSKYRFKRDAPHTYADPFLFIWKDILYLFVETKSFNSPGKIEYFSSENFEDFDYQGTILSDKNHFSFPHIFEDEGKIYMIPETSALGEVGLYKFEDFPNRISKVKNLIEGNFFDSSIIKINDIYYIFTSNTHGMNIYFAESISSNFISHPINPITKNKKFSRNAGPITRFDNKYFRFSQDCSNKYGENINIHEIKSISKDLYHEELKVNSLFNNSKKIIGRHHISIVSNNNDYYVAIDKKTNDSYMNKVLSLIYRYND